MEELQPRAAAPVEELSQLVAWGAALFYWAEEGRNEGVRTYWDALHYIATSLSVGYANIFPVTPLGKAIGAVVQIVGPALSARALEPAAPLPSPAPLPSAARGGDDAVGGAGGSDAVVARLDAILRELQQLNAAR